MERLLVIFNHMVSTYTIVFARAIKSSRDHVCGSADVIANGPSRKMKRPEMSGNK